MDVLTPAQRHANMSAIKGKDTKPEMALRRGLHAAGVRYRLHRKDLPGKPDLVLPGYGVVIFVNGCFWHRHESCRYAATPASNKDFWREKLEKNVERDRKNQELLREMGWEVIVVWECELKAKNLPALLEGLLERLRACKQARG